MAILQGRIDQNATRDGAVITFTWGPFTNNTDVGTAMGHAEYSYRTYIVTGDFASGGSVVLEGSNDGTNWVALTNRQGTAMVFTAPGMNTSQDMPMFARPRMTAGTSTGITIIAACHRQDIPTAS
jgi:hypothetical protein